LFGLICAYDKVNIKKLIRAEKTIMVPHGKRRILALGFASLAFLFFFSASSMATSFPVVVGTGDSFDVDFNGFVGSPSGVIPGLTSAATFSGFTFTFDSVNSLTQVTFSFDLTNNSSSLITGSRVSGLGFFTTPNVNGTGNTVSGVFDNVTVSGNMPNGIGVVEFCFSDVNCSGGASGGVTIGNTGTGLASLYFTGNISSLSFDNIYVRYQDITGVAGISSASGAGTPGGDPGPDVPEPSTLVLLGAGVLGLAAWKRMKG
jgi:hypothetical protein